MRDPSSSSTPLNAPREETPASAEADRSRAHTASLSGITPAVTSSLRVDVQQRSSKLLPGAILNQRYEIEAVIAKGAMGWVYRARHLHLDRVTALKVLDVDQPILNTLEYRKRFCLEALVVASINHANIIRIFDYGFYGPLDIPYISMQFLSGHDALKELTLGPLEPTRAFLLIEQTLSALAIAHLNQIVHKDIKPANLFIQHPNSPNEQLIVLDFGVARTQAQDNSPGMTRVGELAGTPEYLPPEYITHQLVTPSLDVYSTALVLIELLTGQPVVTGATAMERLLAHLQGPLPIPTMLARSSLGPVLARATAPTPEARYEDAAAFLSALQEIEHAFLKEVRQGHLDNSTPTSSRRSRSGLTACLTRARAATAPKLPVASRRRRLTPSRPHSLNNTDPSAYLPTPPPTAALSPEQLFHQGIAAAQRGDFQEALSAFEACYSLHPGHRRAKHNINAIRRRLGITA